jgi:amylosucrase
MDPVNPGVLVLLRRAPGQTIAEVYNVTPQVQSLPRWVIPVTDDAWDALSDESPLTDVDLTLEPYQARWFVQQA